MDYSPTIDELLIYCRADEDDATKSLLDELRDSAVEFLDGAGVELTDSNCNRYKLAIKALVLHWFDNPGGGDLSPALWQMITQLKY